MKNNFSQLVKRARNGDADAFAELYSSVYKELYHIALCNLRNSEDAADAVSDTVLDAFASIKKLKNENAFKAWIVRILMAKIKKKQKEYYRDDDTQYISEVEPEVWESNFDGVEILEVISELEENERLVLSLSIVGGYKSDEIAKMLGGKPATIRSQLSRAKLKLRDLLIAEQEGR